LKEEKRNNGVLGWGGLQELIATRLKKRGGGRARKTLHITHEIESLASRN